MPKINPWDVDLALKSFTPPVGNLVDLPLVIAGEIPPIALIEAITQNGLHIQLSIIDNQGNDLFGYKLDDGRVGTINLVDPLAPLATEFIIHTASGEKLSWAMKRQD